MKLKNMIDLEKGIHVGDLKKVLDEERELGSNWTTSIILAGDLKQEAIKWIKEDLQSIKCLHASWIITRWMKRFNITEENLK